jgi:D-lactate dehydrogenase
MIDVFFYEAFEEETEALASLLGDEIRYECTSKAVQEAGYQVPPARLISIRTHSIVPPAWADQLDGILSRSTGYDHLLTYSRLIEKRLPLGYLEEYASRAVAEHAMMMTMALMRRLPQQIRQFRTFQRDGLTGTECVEKNLLVVGVGRIGSEIVAIAKGLGFYVKGVDIVPDKPEVEYISKERGLLWADVIIDAMNLTSENRGYFNEAFFHAAKSGLFFVSVARGEHSPLGDLQRALDQGKLAGVGLDVFEDEGAVGPALRGRGESSSAIAGTIDRLLDHPNVLCTPHNAFNSHEALRGKAALTVEQVKHFLKHRDFLWKVG